MSAFPSVEAIAALAGHRTDGPVELEFPEGWESGWTIAAVIAAEDRPYRLIATKPGREVMGAAPECVRPEGGAA